MTLNEFGRCAACAIALLATTSAGTYGTDRIQSTDSAPKAAAPAPEPSKGKTKEAISYLAEWPKPENKDALIGDIERLCKANTPLMGVQAREALTADGASAVPFLLERYGREKDAAAIKRLHEVLLETTNASQTRLLAKEFDGKYTPKRTFALWRAAAFPDKELLAPAEAALAHVQKQGDKADQDERYAAALCAVAAGSVKGLEILCDVAGTKWDRYGTEMRVALEAVRGPEATSIALERLAKDDRKLKVAALNILAGCGDKASAGRVRPMLDDSDNTIRIAAINALRGMVDGDPPLPLLSAFEAIETAKKWKARI